DRGIGRDTTPGPDRGSTSSQRRQIEVEGAADSEIVDAQLTAVIDRDAVADREPEPGPLVAALGREEGIEDPRAEVLGDPSRPIGDADPYPSPTRAQVFARSNRDVLGVLDPLMLVERVASVGDQVHDDLLDLLGPAADRREPVGHRD